MLTTVSFDVDWGNLDVTLENGDDVKVQASGSALEVLVNGTPTGPTADVWWINIYGDAGDNSIDLSSVNSADFTGLPSVDVWGNGGGRTATSTRFADMVSQQHVRRISGS